ncbi:MAG: hypothetical protein ACI828_001695 [Flavobacteriales bacterium]|jgi:hypothetical protein
MHGFFVHLSDNQSFCIMMTTIYIVAGILVAVIFLAALGPKTFDVSRSISIDKPIHEVFAYVRSVKNQNDWSPSKLKDPEMFQQYFGEDGTAGFKAYWKGIKEVGEGSQTLVEIIENERIDTRIVFLKPLKSESNGYFTFESEASNTTKIIWGFKGHNKFPATMYMLFFNMDKVVGKDFEEGLGNLKKLLEA